MAGTIPLALSQQLDGNGKPLAGALLYIFQTGTVATPQDSFQDFGLTVKNPNPVVADQNGRIPMLYLADGTVHIRLTDASGVVILDVPTMQVIGPSSGSSGGGSGVDATAIASTGDVKWRPTSETLSGWVRANGQTIGSATSGATQRANADTQNLFAWLWNTFSDTKCPVSGGRGASATADFSANKTITLPDLRGRSPFGLDDMGSTAAGRLLAANVTSGSGDGVTTPGATGGEANHTLTVGELASHGHSVTVSESAHNHSFTASSSGYVSGGSPANATPNQPGYGADRTLYTSSSKTNLSASADSAGGGAAHNNMPPFVLGTFYLKL